MRERYVLLKAALPLGFAGSAFAFDAPITLDPTSNYTASFDSTPGTQSISRVLNSDLSNPKRSIQTSTTSNITATATPSSSSIPWARISARSGLWRRFPTHFVATTTIPKSRCIKADGTPVAISKSAVGLDGNPIVQYPRSSSLRANGTSAKLYPRSTSIPTHRHPIRTGTPARPIPITSRDGRRREMTGTRKSISSRTTQQI